MTDRVLFVSREHGLARALAITLRRHRYAVESAAGVAAAVGALDVRHFAVVVVDVNGVKARAGALTTLRRATVAPLLALVAAAAGGEPRRAIDAGADDILEMPYSVAALVARLDALVGRVDPVYAAGLGPTERAVFDALASHPGRLVTRRRLLREAFGADRDRATEDRLNQTIGALRNKLELDPAEPRRVVAEPGIGYRLTPSADRRVAQP